MPTSSGRVFRSGNSAAVRLPKEVAFEPDTEVTMVRSGDVLTIYPTRPSIAEMIARLNALPRPASTEVGDEESPPQRTGP